MKRKTLILILLINILLISAAAYGQANNKMDINGKISKVVYDENGKLKEILVENNNEDQQSYDKVIAIITENTKILSGDFEISYLKKGQEVGIKFKEGPITMIYPARIEAKIIKVRNFSNKPEIKIPVDPELVKYAQKSVDDGHSPWKLDPIFVTQVFVSLKISPAGITGEYPVKYEDLKVIKKTDHEAVIAVNEDKITPIKKVYLIRQNYTGIWTVIGYDPVGDLEKAIVDEFNAIIKKKNQTTDILKFINSNISLLSDDKASKMINKFEEIQKNNLVGLEKKFNNSEIQSKLINIYQPEFKLDNINDIKEIKRLNDQQLKNLLLETRNSGYKVETAEGMFFPIIDYQYYQRFYPYVSNDIKAYITIMTVESNRVPAKDAALVIAWDKVLKRTLNLESFINRYPNSVKVNDIKNLYKKYLTFTFFGLNNTPLFNYNTRIMDDEAKNIYLKTVADNKKSIFIKTLADYLDLLKENNYRLTERINEFRKNAVKNILSAYDSPTVQKEIINAMQNDIDMLKKGNHVQQIEEENYGDLTQKTCVLKITGNELQFDKVSVLFKGNFKGHYTLGESYPYYIDAAMGGQRGITVKDNFGVWHSFGYRVKFPQ